MDTFITLLATFFLTIFLYLQYAFRYWESRGFAQPLTSYLYGTLPYLKSMHFYELHHNLYKECKGKFKVVGTYLFTTPIAFVVDLDLIKAILIKDFNNFVERTANHDSGEVDPLSQHLAKLQEDKWRNMRHKLTPTLTSGKMKVMLPIMRELANYYIKVLEQEVLKTTDNVLDVYEMNGRFTTDVISNIIFGMENDSMNDKGNPLRKIGRQIINVTAFNIPLRLCKLNYAHLLKKFGLTQKMPKEISNFIVKLVTDTVEYRERNNIKRDDLMDMLIKLKNSKDENGQPELTTNDMAAQVFLFFVAGFETTSSSMSFALYELAKHPHIQDKLRAHIFKVLAKHNNELTWEALSEMTYLKHVMDETLRLHPALIFTTRIAKNDYPVEGTKLVIPAGTKIYMPILEIHMDPDVYENPTKFRPERFEPEEIAKRHPTSFLSFGDGPRNCIGLRFGRLQSRTGLVALLTAFKFSLCEESSKKFEYSRHSGILVPIHGIKLRVEKLTT